MTLAKWSTLRCRSLFDTDYYTVARAWDSAGRRLKWFVIFTNPTPYQVRVMPTIASVADFLGQAPEEVEGRAYTEQDVFRRLDC